MYLIGLLLAEDLASTRREPPHLCEEATLLRNVVIKLILFFAVYQRIVSEVYIHVQGAVKINISLLYVIKGCIFASIAVP